MWYENLKKKRARKANNKTWSRLKRYIDKRFLLCSYKQELYLISQENLKVKEYISEFEQLQLKVGLNKDDKLAIARFINRLSPSIANKVTLQLYLTFDDVCNLAIKVERQVKGRKVFQISSSD